MKRFAVCMLCMNTRVINFRIPPGIRYTGGSDWFVLHRQFVDYVINPPVDDELVNDLVSYFAFTILPAEVHVNHYNSCKKLDNR